MESANDVNRKILWRRMMTRETLRLSSHDVLELAHKTSVAFALGWKVERPIYLDWFWRGYSILLYLEK